MIWDLLAACTGFAWDDGNASKNWHKHQVTQAECEQVFLNTPLLVQYDAQHSQSEERYAALGKTDQARGLLVVFTIRGNHIRVISARDMSRRERQVYAKATDSAL